jgi:pimeloyl-ACP methyl ester carboxylesterase
MARRLVTKPVPGARAFTQTTAAGELSQAAQLLLLGIYLRGDDQAFQARAKLTRGLKAPEPIPERDRATLKLPKVRSNGQRFARKKTQAAHKALFQLKSQGLQMRRRRISSLAKAFHDKPHPRTAAQLLEGCLHHPAELIRVAAASTYFDLTTDQKDLLNILVQGTRSKDPLVAEVAATTLAHVSPDHPRLAKLSPPSRRKTKRAAAHTSLLVHGTWARTQTWWQPGWSFHHYILTSVCNDLYAAPDRFEWSGGYSNQARNLAGTDLANWLTAHNAQDATLFAHSHGGSVAMLASHAPSVAVGKLVLLACPVHVPQYLPDFASVGETISVHVHLDLVILADRGGQRYSHPLITEKILPVWFDHGAPHEEAVWRRYNLRSILP